MSTNALDGFYTAYFTGDFGNSLGLFIFSNGVVVGADAGGGKYDGTYELIQDKNKVLCKVRFTLPSGGYTITGVSASSEAIAVDTRFEMSSVFDRSEIHKILTPIGPINAKFEKLRGL